MLQKQEMTGLILRSALITADVGCTVLLTCMCSASSIVLLQRFAVIRVTFNACSTTACDCKYMNVVICAFTQMLG